MSDNCDYRTFAGGWKSASYVDSNPMSKNVLSITMAVSGLLLGLVVLLHMTAHISSVPEPMLGGAILCIAVAVIVLYYRSRGS